MINDNNKPTKQQQYLPKNYNTYLKIFYYIIFIIEELPTTVIIKEPTKHYKLNNHPQEHLQATI